MIQLICKLSSARSVLVSLAKEHCAVRVRPMGNQVDYPIPEDGKYNRKTKKALQSYLKDYGHNVNTDGMFGDFSVMALQSQLGLSMVRRDGSWGSTTTKALQRYLNEHGTEKVKVNGKKNYETWRALQIYLNHYYRTRYGSPNQAQAQAPTQQQVPQTNSMYSVQPIQQQVQVIQQPMQPQMVYVKQPKQQPQPQPTLPHGWRQAMTADGRKYYQNDTTKKTQWTMPTHAANPVQPKQQPAAKYVYKEEEDEKAAPMNSFKSELNQLLHVIDSHMKFMKTHEKNVDKIIASSGDHANLLRTAKSTALETEKEILNEIMNISTMNAFLNDIILVENLFNSEYTADQRAKQHHARQQYARNIPNYEAKPKPCSKADSFVDLVFYAKSTLGSFKKWLQRITKECEQQKIRIVSNSGAKEKNLERAFYKSFYVYGAVKGEFGYLHMTDVLRCSLVFDDFNDLYRCFAVIEKMLKHDSDGGILRCKDRFDPQDVPFGYRDLLINVHCPGSNKKVICEVQLHHQLFAQHKEVSHDVYKKARIFEDKEGNNMAYEYADRNIRKAVGDKLYQYEQKESKAHHLLKEWDLHQYAAELIDENGYDDVAYWHTLTQDDLVNEMNFKRGHATKFVSLAKTI
eukprot:984616_1